MRVLTRIRVSLLYILILLVWPLTDVRHDISASLRKATQSPSSSSQPRRRALLVGIGNYNALSPQSGVAQSVSGWRNLDGPTNDVDEIYNLLISKYEFDKSDIMVLKDERARREAILSGIRDHLIASAAPGDVAFFFYSGHGSRVKNLASHEPDKMDETLVPFDAVRDPKTLGELKDIRDKELARFYNQALDKGILLTVITDSCHSGSNDRGYKVPAKERVAPAINGITVNDKGLCDNAAASEKCLAATERGALVFSASQEDEVARERKTETGRVHGDFTWALIRVLSDAPARMSADKIYQRVKAFMVNEGREQEPVMGGGEARKIKSLFGTGESESGRVAVAVASPPDNGVVGLLAGADLGLSPGCQLKKASDRAGAPDLRIKVTKVIGLSRSEAEVIQGDISQIRTGNLFEVDLWAVPRGTDLRVLMPPAIANNSGFERVLREIETLRNAEHIEFIDDPTEKTPTHIIYFSTTGWNILMPDRRVESLGASLSASVVLDRLGPAGAARLFINLPPAPEMNIQLGKDKKYKSIAVVAEQAQATYILVGRLRAGAIEYAWILPGAESERLLNISAKILPLPTRSAWITRTKGQANGGAASLRLEDEILRIGKVSAWLNIRPYRTADDFPYKLVLKKDDGETKTEGVVFKDEVYGLLLIADPREMRASISQKFVYVFVLDSSGNSTLLFPTLGKGNVGNRFPYADAQGRYPSEIQLGAQKLFKVGNPLGTDTFILLVSEEAIPDPDVLNWQGLQEKGARSNDHPLARLINETGSTTAKGSRFYPTNWSIQRVIIRSMNK